MRSRRWLILNLLLIKWIGWLYGRAVASCRAVRSRPLFVFNISARLFLSSQKCLGSKVSCMCINFMMYAVDMKSSLGWLLGMGNPICQESLEVCTICSGGASLSSSAQQEQRELGCCSRPGCRWSLAPENIYPWMYMFSQWLAWKLNSWRSCI